MIHWRLTEILIVNSLKFVKYQSYQGRYQKKFIQVIYREDN